jgi:regulator of protease activity HflC (stomatin/prohibitin superfamily)
MVDNIPRTGRNNSGAPVTGGRGGMGVPLIAILLGGGAILVWLGITTIDAGNVGVKLRFGEAVEVMHPGIQFLFPFAETSVIYSTRTVKRTYDKVNSYSKDIQASNSFVSVNYRVDPAKAIQVYTRYGEDFASTVIDPILPKRMKEIFGKYNASEIVTARDKLGIEVETNVRAAMPDGIILDGVQIENIDFSDAYEQAIESAMQAQAEVMKTQQELARQRVEAEKVIVNANAAAEARRAGARAEADAIRLKGEAEAAAIAAKAASLRDSPNLVQLTATEKWNGVLPTTMVPGSAVPFVQVGSGNFQQR